MIKTGPSGQLYTTTDAALYCGVGRPFFVKRVERHGEIPFQMARDVRLFRREDLDAWIHQEPSAHTNPDITGTQAAPNATYLTIPEACDVLGVDIDHMRYLIRTNRITTLKVGKVMLIALADLVS